MQTEDGNTKVINHLDSRAGKFQFEQTISVLNVIHNGGCDLYAYTRYSMDKKLTSSEKGGLVESRQRQHQNSL